MKTAILFGASNLGQEAYERIHGRFTVIHFCDNDPDKWGNTINGVTIVPPQMLQKYRDSYIILTSMYTYEISKQLLQLGIEEFGIYRSQKHSNGKLDTYYIEHFDARDFTDNKKKDFNICMITTSNSGSNVLALYKRTPDFAKNKFSITLCHSEDKKIDFFLGYDFMQELLRNKMIVFDVRSPSFKYEHNIFYQLWHGIPIKGLGYMSQSTSNEKQHNHWMQFDEIASYSQFYNILLSACIGIPREKFEITGMPRNDFLFHADGRHNLSLLLDRDISNKKIVYFMPTYRNSPWLKEQSGNKNWSNVFGIDKFDNVAFDKFLGDNDVLLIMKTHPLEENEVLEYLAGHNYSNIEVITNKQLIDSNMDLYETLNAADLLITDYSSVYFDFLLLDRPILFVPVDIEQYAQTRGLLLEPYDMWTPGPKVYTQETMQKEIIGLLDDISYYDDERRRMKNLVHVFQDGNSSERVWSRIVERMS